MTDREREWQTRKQRIDPRLGALGWTLVRFEDGTPLNTYARHAVEEYETANGPADYALCLDGRILGIVEAKRITLGPQESLPQAERYSRGATANPFDFRGFHVPFLYSTNGEVIWFHDIRHPLSRSRRIAGFHTPGALEEMLGRDFGGACAWFTENPSHHPDMWPYQVEACQAIEAAISDRKRQMLLAMATGTGKTFTIVNEVYRLMKSGVGKRVLFLVDRRALAAQAVREFASFEAEPNLKFNQVYEVYSQRFRREDWGDEPFDPKVLPSSYLLDPQPGHAFVYVSTIQRMAINLFGRGRVFEVSDEPADDDAEQMEIPIHAFDAIVADECHRGYTTAELSVWRDTLDHFDAIKIGLTATPASHTKAYFRDVVYRYGYEQAVSDGYLVDYDAVAVKSDVRLNGVFLDEGERVRVVDPNTGADHLDAVEDERAFEASEVERRITSPDSNRKILEVVRDHAIEHEQETGRLPKTLIFAVNDLPHTSHADQLVDIARDVFGRGDSFVQKITGRVDRPLQRIREFRNRPEPGVVVTVDMLSTGVDIPDLEFIVFLRPVKSRILFEQMMGRGTRRGFTFKDKSHFVVFDCFDGSLLDYFARATGITAEPPDRPSRTIVEVIEAVWQNRDRAYNIRCLVKRLQRIDKQMSAEARDAFKAYIPGGDMAKYAEDLPRRLREDFTGEMALLRDPEFQDLLTNYHRAPRVFIVAEESEDEVSSRWLIRGGDGTEYRPEDYLEAFARFVRENPARIDAIGILLDRPQDWSTDAIEELRGKLAATRERFTIARLQKAHRMQYHKALVEIISMVKHAAREEEPLYTAEERVDRAVERVTTGQEFTEEQGQWLRRIRDHLIENLSIDREDFDLVPLFTRVGGWGRANTAFEGRLPVLIRELNEAMAA